MSSFVCILYTLFILILVKKCEQKVDFTNIEIVKTVFPEVYFERKKRESNEIDFNPIKVVKVGDWLVELDPQRNLFLSRRLKTEWFNSDDSWSQSKPKKCDYRVGVIKGLETDSKAVMTLCGAFIRGYFDVRSNVYFLEPLDENSREHVIYKSKLHNILKRTTAAKLPPAATVPSHWRFNLTGDMIDIDTDIEEDIESKNNLPEPEEMSLRDPDDAEVRDNTTENWSAQNNWDWAKNSSGVGIRGELYPLGGDEEENGYFYDTAWTSNMLEVHKFSSGSMLPPRWMEIAVAVDHTLIAFHGKSRVEEYVLSLLNIVSAIYQDPSLESNMKLVITKLLMYEHKKYSHKVVRIGNAKRSLENVNYWNKALHASLSDNEPKHDLAIWLTRSDIGGPSGYAPVGGVCDPKRSCALNRDEGLTSAFIIAHETAHILGLSHDGDVKNGNNCSDDALDGSVMAPMVSATFNKFYWSRCSRRELRKYRNKWMCLLNSPAGADEIMLNATLQASFTMDQQCRMEFGDGYTMCKAFDIIEPCSHLWCGHEKSPLVCKTKKGPPLEGTECGFGKWCVDGYCEDFANRRVERVPVVLNPQDGQWGEWSLWKPCSRTCGTGVQFRTRKCDNPPPSFGGKSCEGKEEEWRLCKTNICPEHTIDIRAQQCKQMPIILNLPHSSSHFMMNSTWLPYESDENAKKCKFICLNSNKKELYFTNENLVDGTPCSYDNEDNICVQGVCQVVGCDEILHSPLRRDKCGVCNGNNSECTDVKRLFHRILKKESSRISVLPEKSRAITVELNVTKYHSDNPILALILKNRKKKSYSVITPDSEVRSKIFEGAKFYYKNVMNRFTIWSTGPTQYEMVVLVIVSKNDLKLGTSISYSTEFTVHKDYLTVSKRFVWILGGWGPCSASCDGGRRQRTAACFDKNTNKIVRRTECALIHKPKLEFEKCNTFSCNFKWASGEWEPCTTSCGTLGVQHREIYCLPNSILEKYNGTISQPWRYMVDYYKCGDNKPTTLRSCNRQPCFSYWTFGNWTQCSATCGPGFQTRSSHCLPPQDETFFTCGDSPSPQRRSCFGAFNRFNNPLCRGRKKVMCQKDESEYCGFHSFERYCKINVFKRMCCKFCGSNLQSE